MRLNYLNLLFFFLLTGVTATNLQAEETVKKVILYTPYTQISVPPGESINYSIDVINQTQEVRNASLQVQGLPRSWTYDMKAGGFTIKELSVLPDEKKNFSLTVQVPQKVNKGTYRFTVSADGLGELPLTVVVSEQGTYKTEFTTTQPNMQGNSKATFTFSATLKNSTAEQQLYALTANAPRGWNVVFKVSHKQATSAQVAPNGTENINIDITPPSTIEAGTYKIPVRASTGTTSGDIEFEVVITGSYEVQLTTPRGLLSTDITAGSTKRIDLVVKNTGSAELKEVKLSSSKPVDWEVDFSPEQIESLKPGETAEVKATVKASKKALPGDYIAKMEARNPEANSSADFRMSVKTPMIWGWTGIIIIVAVLGIIWFLFRKYGRR